MSREGVVLALKDVVRHKKVKEIVMFWTGVKRGRRSRWTLSPTYKLTFLQDSLVRKTNNGWKVVIAYKRISMITVPPSGARFQIQIYLS